MKSRNKNTFKRAVHHLKSTQIDEKIELLNELPTNNTSGIYLIQPDGFEIIDQDVTAPLNLEQDDPTQNGRDTTGLFGEDGSILSIEPPGDTSYVLGPMMSMWYAWGNFTTIGYIRESDRRMVDLGRITGTIQNWNSSSFTSYGQLTLEQAQWYKQQVDGGNVQNYRAFYPGPPSNPADNFGRYLGLIVNVAKQISKQFQRRIPPVMGGFDKNLPPGSARPKTKKKKDGASGSGNFVNVAGNENPKRTVVKPTTSKGLNVKTVYHGTSKSAEQGIRQTGFRTTKTGLSPNKVWVGDKSVAQKYAQGGYSSGSMAKNPPEQQSVMKMRIPKGSGVTVPGPFGKETAISKKTADVGAGLKPKRVSSGAKAGTTVKVTGVPRGGGGGGLVQAIEPWYSKVDPLQGYTWDSKSNKYRLANSQEITGNFLSESKRKILRDIKKPYILPEEPKLKFKHKPKFIGSENRTINSDLMKKAEVPSSFKRPEERMWGKYEKEQNARFSQERKNEILDHLGGSDHAWEYMTETSRKKGNDIMYGNFDGKNIIRKEELKGDTLLFIVDENGKKESILQSELSIRIADEFNKELFEKYFKEQETINADKDPLFKKVSKKLKNEIDYSDKPSVKGYPNDPPPKTINGWHPDYGKRKSYYKKLDPKSASSMPLTGDSGIDAEVKASEK